MGEMADFYLDSVDFDDESEWHTEIHDSPVSRYMEMAEEDLRKEARSAKEPKIVSIRNWRAPLSKKQRYCLAFWCVKRDKRLRI